MKEDIEKVSLPKKTLCYKARTISRQNGCLLIFKLDTFLCSDKVREIPISNKFIQNVTSILQGTRWIQHSHIIGNIYTYAHTFCNENVRENYFKIPVIAHNLFRFDFFFLVKGLGLTYGKLEI